MTSVKQEKPHRGGFRVTMLAPDGERWQMYFSTGGFVPERPMTRQEAGEHALASHPADWKLVRVIRRHYR